MSDDAWQTLLRSAARPSHTGGRPRSERQILEAIVHIACTAQARTRPPPALGPFVACATAPSLGALRTLQRAHVLSLGWENLDAILHGPRGAGPGNPPGQAVAPGARYEHVTLLTAALEALGYRFTAVSGRARTGSSTVLPATHAMLVVELEGRRRLDHPGADGWAVCRRSGDSPDTWLSMRATPLNPQYPPTTPWATTSTAPATAPLSSPVPSSSESSPTGCTSSTG
ncbi:arylamine N-acetyltransferase [Streptomyces griseus]|uniref:arylamine N-acetyltransferase n=1 Tax=Streptomyces griseus TaxID=1911 RepID=UPI00099B98A3